MTTPQTLTPARNAATIVLTPGTYSTLTIEYTFYNTYKNKNITTCKTYNNVVLTAGKNKSIKADLNIPACKFLEDYYFGRNTQVSSCPNMNEIV